MIEKYALFKVISALIHYPKESSVRHLAKKSDVGVATSKRSLDYLFEKDIVKRKVIGKSHLYSLNLENILTRQIKILFSLSQIKESGLIKELKKKFPSICSIILFGSAAIGKDNPSSDIDILIISYKKVKISPLQAEKKLNREITFLSYTLSEWRQKAKKEKPFYDRVIIDGISLYGEKPVVY